MRIAKGCDKIWIKTKKITETNHLARCLPEKMCWSVASCSSNVADCKTKTQSRFMIFMEFLHLKLQVLLFFLSYFVRFTHKSIKLWSSLKFSFSLHIKKLHEISNFTTPRVINFRQFLSTINQKLEHKHLSLIFF